VKSSNIYYIPKLDHLRGLAAMIIFMFHLYHYFYHHWQPNPDAWFMGLIVEGHTGIGLFFVLSGFIFMLIRLNASEMHYWDFMRNRFLRIFPLFLLVFFVAISIGRNDFRAPDVLYLFFSNLGQAPTSNQFITGAAWSISVEFTFYAIFPFIALAAINKGIWYLPRLILILLLFKLGAYAFSELPKHMYYSTLLGRLDQFLIGMLGASLYLPLVKRQKLAEWYWLPIAAFVCWAGVGVMAHDFSYLSNVQKDPFWIIWPTLEALLWLGIVLTYLRSAVVIPKLINKLLELMGQVSYSWYLLHTLVLALWLHLFEPIRTGFFMLDFLLSIILVGAVSLALAKLSYHTLEEPFLGMRKRYTVS
jgi:peptidoglycan/LPS O-acetylase OafA/YrhL